MFTWLETYDPIVMSISEKEIKTETGKNVESPQCFFPLLNYAENTVKTQHLISTHHFVEPIQTKGGQNIEYDCYPAKLWKLFQQISH